MLAALLIFPCCAILWLLILNRFGLVQDEPLIRDDAHPKGTTEPAWNTWGQPPTKPAATPLRG